MNVHPFVTKIIPLADDPLSKCSLKDILSRVKLYGILESDYDKVDIRAETYRRSSDSYLECVYNKPKTKNEIESEQQELLKKKQKEKDLKEQKKKEKLQRKIEKEKILSTLSPKEKKILGL